MTPGPGRDGGPPAVTGREDMVAVPEYPLRELSSGGARVD